MTNTLNTPIERLEQSLPVLVTHLGLRSGSAGTGLHRGGEGIIREYQLLEEMQVSILSERRTHSPSGLAGGEDGKCGLNQHRSQHSLDVLPGKWQGRVAAGDSIRIETPGGGGWGIEGTE
jgi:N-methylhydantoinase B